MKHLKKYNESSIEKKESIDFNKLLIDIKDCFAEFFDEDNVDLHNDDNEITLYIDIPTLYKNKIEPIDTGDISEFINIHKKSLDIYEDINVAIMRLKDNYPSIGVNYLYDFQEPVKGEKKFISYLSIYFYDPSQD